MRWQPSSGTMVPSRWRWWWARGPRRHRAPCRHRGRWTSTCHGCGWWWGRGRRAPRSRGTRSTTRRGCRGRRSCCASTSCGGRSRSLARSPDQDFATCFDSCSVSLPCCCTGSQPRGSSEPLPDVSFSSEQCLGPPRHRPPGPTLDQQDGSGCAPRAADGGRGDRPPTLKACPLTLAADGAKAPDKKKDFFIWKTLGQKISKHLVVLMVFARSLRVNKRQSFLLGLRQIAFDHRLLRVFFSCLHFSSDMKIGQ